MALIYVYSDSTGSTIDITDRCRLYQLSIKDQAEEGAVAISSLTIDDPDGDLEITGHRRLYIYEDTAPSGDQMVFNGFTSNERIQRGPSGRTGASRQWVVDLADVNVLINRRIMNGPDANRPAENDTERIQALFGMTELNTVDDDSLVSLTATTVPMDAADYRGQNVGAYIDDCRQASGKNAYIYYNETLGEYGLWYDFAQSEEYDSGCFLTNTIGESNGTTIFNYSLERTYLNRDPSRVASGIYLEYDGGLVYLQSPSTIDLFAAIDWAAPSVNVKTLAKATARATRYLVDAATEHEVIHVVQTDVPRASINAIKKGQLVSFKSSYMTGYEEYRVCRVLYRQVNEIAEDPESSFEIEMDLDPVSITPPFSFGWVNLRNQLDKFGIESLSNLVTDASPGFVEPVGGDAVVPGDAIAALFVLPWVMTGVAGTGQSVDPDPPAEAVMMTSNTIYEAGYAEMVVDPTSGTYQFWGSAGGLGRDGVSTIACFPTASGSPYTRVQEVIANGVSATLSSPATLGNLLILSIVTAAGNGYFPGYIDTDTPDIPDQDDWTAVVPTAKPGSPHVIPDVWHAERLYYAIAVGGETAFPIDPGTWPLSTVMVIEYAP